MSEVPLDSLCLVCSSPGGGGCSLDERETPLAGPGTALSQQRLQKKETERERETEREKERESQTQTDRGGTIIHKQQPATSKARTPSALPASPAPHSNSVQVLLNQGNAPLYQSTVFPRLQGWDYHMTLGLVLPVGS